MENAKTVWPGPCVADRLFDHLGKGGLYSNHSSRTVEFIGLARGKPGTWYPEFLLITDILLSRYSCLNSENETMRF